MPGFAYGDSVKTGDDKYVLAQFRYDAILAWVAELRSFLDLKELKWRDYKNRRELRPIESSAESECASWLGTSRTDNH